MCMLKQVHSKCKATDIIIVYNTGINPGYESDEVGKRNGNLNNAFAQSSTGKESKQCSGERIFKIGKNVLLFLEVTVLTQIGAAFAWSLEMLGMSPTLLHAARSSFY